MPCIYFISVRGAGGAVSSENQFPEWKSIIESCFFFFFLGEARYENQIMTPIMNRFRRCCASPLRISTIHDFISIFPRQRNACLSRGWGIMLTKDVLHLYWEHVNFLLLFFFTWSACKSCRERLRKQPSSGPRSRRCRQSWSESRQPSSPRIPCSAP